MYSILSGGAAVLDLMYYSLRDRFRQRLFNA